MQLRSLPAVGVLVAILGFVAPAHAGVFAGVNGKLLYQQGPSGSEQIFVSGFDGSGPNAITAQVGDARAEWSPDGTRIAYGSGGNIYVINADGSNVRQLTASGNARDPTWSPDGAQIAYVQCVACGTDDDIWVMNSDGSNQHDITNSPNFFDADPSWSPDGTRIAASGITTNPVGSQYGIYLVDPTGVSPPSGPLGQGTTSFFVTFPAWSPDGRQILFQSGASQTSFHLWLMNADGTSLHELTPTAGTDEKTGAWSPDGTRIAFASNATAGYQLYTVNPDGSAVKQITSAGNPSLFPDWQLAHPALALTPAQTTPAQGASLGVSVSETDPTGNYVGAIPVVWTVSGANTASGSATTAADGSAAFTISGANPGTDTITAFSDLNGDGVREATEPQATTSVTWTVPPPPPPAARPVPVENETVTAEPVAGTILVRVPAATNFVPLQQLLSIPLGSIVDARHGRVRICGAFKGKIACSTFYGGMFRITQVHGVVVLTLFGGNFSVCRAATGAGAVAAAAKRPKRPIVVRELWGSGAGKFQTNGRYASAAIRGTTWLTADRCDGTLVRVTAGAVTVRDFVKRTTVVVRARHSYVAHR